MMNFFFSRVRPPTASGHGVSRCQARLSVVLFGLREPGESEAAEDGLEDHPMQDVELGPGQLAASDTVHARRVAGAPGVGELRPVHGHTLPLRQRLDFTRDRRAPVDDRAEGVEHQRLHRRQAGIPSPAVLPGWRTPRAAPARTTPAPTIATAPACSSSRRDMRLESTDHDSSVLDAHFRDRLFLHRQLNERVGPRLPVEIPAGRDDLLELRRGYRQTRDDAANPAHLLVEVPHELAPGRLLRVALAVLGEDGDLADRTASSGATG